VDAGRPRDEVIVTWLVRGVIAVGLPVLTGLLLVGGLIAWAAYGQSHRNAPPPDVAAYARSEPVRHADAQTAVWSDGQFAQLGRQAPWLRPAGYSVIDNCGAEATSAPDGPVASWSFHCQRVQVGYFVFAGAGTRSAELERALTRMGWGGFGFIAARPVAGQPGASALLSAAYPPPGWAGQSGMSVSWINAAQRRELAAYVRFVIPAKTSVQDPVQIVPPDLSEISRAAAGPGKDLIAVELVTNYATQAPAS
jgi:hypothetical protein